MRMLTGFDTDLLLIKTHNPRHMVALMFPVQRALCGLLNASPAAVTGFHLLNCPALGAKDPHSTAKETETQV